MCGIMANIGSENAASEVLAGLKKLEYRGYDSAGVAVFNNALNVFKAKGKVADLENHIKNKSIAGLVAMGHTRWATHGVPAENNAHPHMSENGRLVMVHNGIIENYQSLKNFLTEKGYSFKSETDSEVLVQYIAWYQDHYQLELTEAVRRSLGDVEGSYAFVILDSAAPNTMVAAKNDNPLVVGISESGFYLASDVFPLTESCDKAIYLEDQEIITVHLEGDYEVIDFENVSITPETHTLERKDTVYSKEGFDSFMLKEIYEQPDIIARTLESYVDTNLAEIKIEAIDLHRRFFKQASRIVIVGCGTSWHAGLIAEYLIESMAGIQVEVEYASEFRYRDPLIGSSDIVIGISQSGETADTLAAIKLANERGAFTYGIINTPGSTIARHTDVVSYIQAGVEIGVASTKAFTGQVSLLTLIALKLATITGKLNPLQCKKSIDEFLEVPSKMQEALLTDQLLGKLSQNWVNKESALFLGRGLNFPVALEGALKLKEISYIHAEGYPAAEMKHGPIALVDSEMPVFILATNKSAWLKLTSNIQEIKSRKGEVIVIRNAGMEIDAALADFQIEIPTVSEFLTPLTTVVPLQLISYYIAKGRGCNIDQPRNLAKSVTVE